MKQRGRQIVAMVAILAMDSSWAEPSSSHPSNIFLATCYKPRVDHSTARRIASSLNWKVNPELESMKREGFVNGWMIAKKRSVITIGLAFESNRALNFGKTMPQCIVSLIYLGKRDIGLTNRIINSTGLKKVPASRQLVRRGRGVLVLSETGYEDGSLQVLILDFEIGNSLRSFTASATRSVGSSVR